MSTDVADATTEAQKKRGGQRGDRPWRDKPTPRERVLNQSLADHIKENTGKDVSPETVRAVRFSLLKWSKLESTTTLRQNMDKKLEKAKLQDKREKALAMLKEAESELTKFDDEGDTDDEDEDDEDESESEDVDTDSDSDDDDDDPFGDEDGEQSFG